MNKGIFVGSNLEYYEPIKYQLGKLHLYNLAMSLS